MRTRTFGHALPSPLLGAFVFFLLLPPQIGKEAQSRSYDTILVEKQLEKNDLECIAKRNCQTFFFGLYNLLVEDYMPFT